MVDSSNIKNSTSATNLADSVVLRASSGKITAESLPITQGLGNNFDFEGKLLFAVPKKGRLAEQAMALLEGVDIRLHRKNRLDIAPATNVPVVVIFLPAHDIAKFVGEGNVDMGITGQDMIAEADVHVNEVMKLGFGKCRLCVQVPVASGITKVEQLVGKRIVTSFSSTVKRYFEALDKKHGATTPTHIEYVSGSVEAACALGLADGIVDLVESGDTMKAAGLMAIDTLLTSEAVVLSNPHTNKQALVDKFVNRMRGIIDANRYVQCVYNAPRAKLAEVTKITPGNKAPTIQPLEDEAWVSVSAMVPKNETARVMDELEEHGATDILIFAMSNCRLQKP